MLESIFYAEEATISLQNCFISMAVAIVIHSDKALLALELVEINSKGTGSTCSVCGGAGKFIPNEGFACSECGCITDIGLNSARNIEKKYKVILCKDEDKQTF